jgi:hypothetical protein
MPISRHLLSVARALRDTSEALPDPVRDRRLALLAVLHAYARAGRFPRHPDRPQGRPAHVPGGYAHTADTAPAFIDVDGTACAVGELLRASGEHRLAERIARAGNHRFVSEMDEPALGRWAAGHGFLASELARIQPGYPVGGFQPVEVYTLEVDVERSAVSSRLALGNLLQLHKQISSCLQRFPSEGTLHVVQICDGPCASTWYGEMGAVMRCASGEMRGFEGRVDLVATAVSRKQPTRLQREGLESLIGREPPEPELPRFDEPFLELWIDSSAKTSALPREWWQGVEQCVRVEGSVPARGTITARTGPYGSWVRLEAGPPLETRGEGPEGWWRPASP